MNENMSQKIYDGITDINDGFIEEALSLKPKRKIWLKWGAVAACIALLAAAVYRIPVVQCWLGIFPSYENAMFSASEIADLFEKTYGVPTNAYKKVYVPDASYLGINTIPHQKKLNIYQYFEDKDPIDEDELKIYAENLLPLLCKSLNISVPEYEITKQKYGLFLEPEYYSLSANSEKYRIHMIQYSTSFYRAWLRGEQIMLDGESVQVDAVQSDEEILLSLENVKQKLCNIFNVNFDAAKVFRRCDAYGNIRLGVAFYRGLDETLSEYGYFSNAIFLDFNSYGNTVKTKELLMKSVEYRWSQSSDKFERIAEADMISLLEAEWMLKNGYVFGNPVCPRCMVLQEKLDISDYDYVGFEYICPRFLPKNVEKTVYCVPFYTFYKYIGDAENGNQIYAKTYVCAIGVSGIKEYFQSLEKAHHKD